MSGTGNIHLFYLLQMGAARQTCSFPGEGAHNEQIREKF